MSNLATFKAAMIQMRQRWGEEVFNEMYDLACSQG